MLLMIVLIIVTVLTFIGIARAVYSRGVTSQVLRSSLGIQAQTLAESAAEEALLDLRRRVNDPSHEAFAAFRSEVYAGEAGDFDVGLTTPRYGERLAADPSLRAFVLEETEARVRFQRQFSAAPYERYGLVEVSAEVGTSLGFADSVTRRVGLGVEFKVHLLGPPRPFDQTAVYVHDGEGLLRDAYRRIEDAAQNIEDVRADHDSLTQEVENRKGSLPFSGESMLSRYEGVRIPPRDYWRSKAPEFRPPAVLYALGRDPAGVDLKELDVARRVEEAWGAVQRTSASYQEARIALEGGFENPGRHDDYLGRLRILLGAYSEIFGVIDKIRGEFKIFDGADYPKLGDFAYKLSRGEWRRKVTVNLDRDPQGRKPQDVLEAMLKDKGRLNGVFYTAQGSITLRNRTLPGRVVLVCEGGSVDLAHLNADAGDTDIFTVVSFGKVKIQGVVKGGVLALGSLEMDDDAEIHGPVVFDKVTYPESIRGRAIYEDTLYSGRTTPSDTSGANTNFYWVTLAPRPIYRAVDRH
jgi:hypothetical protein